MKRKQTQLAKPARPGMNESVEFSISSKIESVEVVGSVAKRVSARMGFDEDPATWIELAVQEAVVNAITHGNNYSADKKVDVKFLIEQDAVTIHVRDLGGGFEPECLPDPLDPENLLKPTGLESFACGH